MLNSNAQKCSIIMLINAVPSSYLIKVYYIVKRNGQ